MKKLFICLILAFSLILAGNAMADEVTKTLTFQWDMADTTNLKEWKLLWSDTAGQGYDLANPVAVIQYDPAIVGPTYSSPVNANVTGNQATHVIKHFVMIACGDVPQPDGTKEYLCSAYSNEVSWDFWIPAGKFSIPINFQIIAQ